MNSIFAIVYEILARMSALTGLSYNEINIIVYYMVIPFAYLALLDRILKKHFLKIGFSVLLLAFFLFVNDFSRFSDRLFHESVVFLLWFGRVGLDYTAASVVICVFIPLSVFLVTFHFAKKAEKVEEE